MFTKPAKAPGKRITPFAALLSFFFLCLFTEVSLAQTTEKEEAAIKKVLMAETPAFIDRDANAWQATWLRDSRASRTLVESNFLEDDAGWSNFGPEYMKWLILNPATEDQEFIYSNYKVHSSGNMAWVSYDLLLITPHATPRREEKSKETRMLVKDRGVWKIMSQTSYLTETFEASPQAIEYSLNTIGYKLLLADKHQEAIEILKLNVKLHPDTWNTYYSLGRAYDEEGDAKRAARYYRKSIKLNPENVHGKRALEMLRQTEDAFAKEGY